jgi:hypothetical protein
VALLAQKTAAAQREREARELQLAAEREAQRRWETSCTIPLVRLAWMYATPTSSQGS